MAQIILIIINFFSQPTIQVAEQIYPILFKENLLLSTHDISKTFKLNENEFVLIGKNKIHSIRNEGHRILYLARDSSFEKFSVKYISNPKGEAYVYKPYFFTFPDGEMIMIAEEGYEFSSGIDIFSFKDNEVKFFGHVPVSGPNRDSVINQIKIEKQNEEYSISFTGKVEYEISSENIIDGSKLSVKIIENKLQVSLE